MRTARGASLAGRLVLLFALASTVMISGAVYTLYHALSLQLDAQNNAEITGKTEVVRYILRDIVDADTLRENLGRLHDISVGHPHLTVGVWQQGRWLVPPRKDIEPVAAQEAIRTERGPYVERRIGGETWWLHRVDHAWRGGNAESIVVVLAIETTETRRLLRDHAIVAFAVVAAGTLAAALLAWLVVRRSLAPLAQLASRAGQVTAQRLGARLDVHDAPREVHGLADSINRMLERLEQSFRDLEQFSADIAHELRTPINNLLLQTQVTLSRPRPAEDYQEALHSNLVELERLHRMVSEMLFLARADRGMLQLASEDIDLAAEMRSVAEYFEALMEERGQSVVIEGAASIRSDRTMVRRALTNLMSNAVRYAPDRAGIRAAIATSGRQAEIEICNPADIREEELQRLFARFARREPSRARDTEGAGLGLAIVATIMQMLGGEVEARSREGTVTFVLRFPAAATSAGVR